MPQQSSLSESAIATLQPDEEGQCSVSPNPSIAPTTTTMATKDILSMVLQLLPPLHDDPSPPEVSSKGGKVSCSHARSVRFSPDVEVYPVLHRRDMSDDEIRNAWISRYERRQNKTDIQSTIFLLKTGVGTLLTEEDSFCSRGLEHLCYDKSASSSCGYDADARKSQKIALAMQRILRRVGATNPDMIAKAYRRYTLRSRSVAYRKALDDQAATATR